jgi:virulence factor Mce-like protein
VTVARRILPLLLAAAIAVVAVLALLGVIGGGDDDTTTRYRLQIDNAFGLTEGSELRVAGVRAGRIERMRLNEERMLAELDLTMTERGFGDLRRDVRCESKPQSLIGEYYVDCQPGRSPQRLPENGVIPVEQTSSVVPADLIQNIMRRPYRERFSILLSELGMGLASRGRDVNETIRRAVPALRETNKVLRILASERKTISSLYQRADTVLAEVADRRRDVGRFVTEARDVTRAYANRAGDVDRQFELFPEFLDELRPTLAALEGTARAQRPALANLRVAARPLARLLDTSAAFSTASRPAVRALADASRTGERAFSRSLPNLQRLSRTVRELPETATNLGMILDHVDDPRWTVERDARSPRGGSGFTGLESLMRFVYLQSQGTNWFDEDSYLIKILQYTDDECGPYADAERAREVPDRCHAWLGDDQPGVTTPGDTAPGGEETDAPSGPGAIPARAERQAESEFLDYLLAP